MPVPRDSVDAESIRVPVSELPTVGSFKPSSSPGVTRFSVPAFQSTRLEGLLDVHPNSDALVVSFHGALNRASTILPRFERFKSIRTEAASGLYFADPALQLNPKLELAWFTGDVRTDLYGIIARIVDTVAQRIGANKVVLVGSSGGGTAALQVGSYLNGVVVVAFNAQTTIPGYLADATRKGPLQVYVDTLLPELAPGGFSRLSEDADWYEPVWDRLSVQERYSSTRDVRLLLVQNTEEFHYRDHYMPFLAACARGGNLSQVCIVEYEGSKRHNPPPPRVFSSALKQGIEWAQ